VAVEKRKWNEIRVAMVMMERRSDGWRQTMWCQRRMWK
jgi:hypothetical protein